MQKRYQVFVSSTFKDLEEERKEVMKALLELRCIPAGMEMFPAANDEQWKLIQRVIDDSDYYVVIVGGRYGSMDGAGMSYTEKEYRYAVQKGIPVFGFVHGDPGKIAGEKLESDARGKKKLETFRRSVESKHVKYWQTAVELGGVVSRAIAIAEKDAPRLGWVRGDKVLTEEHAEQVLSLQKKLADLQGKLDAASGPPPGAENLAQGEDVILLQAQGWDYAENRKWNKHGTEITVSLTWNSIFRAVAPLLASQATKSGWRSALEELCRTIHRQEVERRNAASTAERERLKNEAKEDEYSFGYRYLGAEHIYDQVELTEKEFSRVVLQLRALGLIRQRGSGGGFLLTEYGDRLALSLSAIPRAATS